MQLKSPYWLGLFPLLLLLQLAFPNRVWVVLLVGLGGAWVVAFIWARELTRNLHLVREMRFGWAQVGDRLEERFTLVNFGWVPALWVEVADQSTLPGYQINQVRAVGSQTKNSWKTTGECTRRGLFTLGPTSLRTGDPLGLFNVEIQIPGSTALMVMPPVVPLPGIDIAPGGRAGDGKRARPNAFERTVSASSVRKYQTADNPHWIHWPLSIRHQELYVRSLDSTPASDWWIFLDLEQKTQVGQGWNTTVEHGVILAASIADIGLRAGHSVGLVTAGEDLVWLPPKNALEQRTAILRSLALASPGSTSLADLLETARPALRHGASLILITPTVDGEWLKPLSLCVRVRLTPTVLLFDPPSYGASGDPAHTQLLLARLGVSPYIVRRELLDRPEAHPGHQGEWEWRVTGFGRAIPVRKPADLGWRKVGA
jgi:uncharacterized protein (DUF58 family)